MIEWLLGALGLAAAKAGPGPVYPPKVARRLEAGEMGGHAVSCGCGPARTTRGSNCCRKDDLETDKDAERGTDLARVGEAGAANEGVEGSLVLL
jgi:hypothetical protein